MSSWDEVTRTNEGGPDEKSSILQINEQENKAYDYNSSMFRRPKSSGNNKKMNWYKFEHRLKEDGSEQVVEETYERPNHDLFPD